MLIADRHWSFGSEFDTEWYIAIGSSICFTMLVQSFSTKGSDIFRILLHVLQRFYDRGFQFSITKHKGSDIPNTRQVRQEDLQEIYTGR